MLPEGFPFHQFYTDMYGKESNKAFVLGLKIKCSLSTNICILLKLKCLPDSPQNVLTAWSPACTLNVLLLMPINWSSSQDLAVAILSTFERYKEYKMEEHTWFGFIDFDK